jgi:hypothetical protein
MSAEIYIPTESTRLVQCKLSKTAIKFHLRYVNGRMTITYRLRVPFIKCLQTTKK